MELRKNQIANGKTYLYFHTHWGQNTNINQAYYNSAVLSVYINEDPISPLIDTTFYRYSDYNFDKITQIDISDMTPYVVIPPAPKPLELIVDEHTSKQITFAYSNPLYGMKSSSLDEFEELGSIFFDVSNGDDVNDYSVLNDTDPTLSLNKYEKRKDTYEKQITLPQELINKINKKAIDYINELLEETKDHDSVVLQKSELIPEGGLQGIIYKKIDLMKKKKINVYLQVDEDINKLNFDKLNSNQNKDICTIIGIFLDNALEAAEKAKDKNGNYRCACCGVMDKSRIYFQVDHIISMNNGGKSVADNLQILCRQCNGSKGDQ